MLTPIVYFRHSLPIEYHQGAKNLQIIVIRHRYTVS